MQIVHKIKAFHETNQSPIWVAINEVKIVRWASRIARDFDRLLSLPVLSTNDMGRLIASSLSAFISKILNPRVSHMYQKFFCNYLIVVCDKT